MVRRYWVFAMVSILAMSACVSDHSRADKICSGSQGKALTCESPGARPVLASRFDATRGCFEAFASPAGWCAVPTYCPGGGGAPVCAVAPSGAVYLTYLLYGEETTMPDWHFDDLLTSTSPLNSSEEMSCMSLWAAFDKLVDADGGVADERVLYAGSTSVRATPACD